MIKAHLITIGDEILIGQIVDTNSEFMAKELNKVGINIQEISSISDKSDDIKNTLNRAAETSDVIIMSGGLGPTKDDITKLTLAEYFDSHLIMDNNSLNHIKLLFEKVLKKPVNQANMNQALVLECSEPLKNKLGTAPGLWIEKNGKIFVSLPGVPYEMKQLMLDEVLPRLQKYFDTPYIIHKTLLCINIPESNLSEMLNDFENNLPLNIKLAYLPTDNRVRLRLSGMSTDENALQNSINEQVKKLENIIGENLINFDNSDIEAVLGHFLKQMNLTIATAESCTGGMISHLITSISGSSKYFQGGIIPYKTILKTELLGIPNKFIEKHGVVSEEVAVEMAKNIRIKLKASIGIATTGVAGPNFGDDDTKIGLVWIGIVGDDFTITKKIYLPKHSRAKFIDATSKRALGILLNHLIN